MLSPKTLLHELTFTVFDTETTGFSPYKGARLLEIGAVKIEPGFRINLQNPFNELINPKVPIPYQAYKVHGISDDMVADKPTADAVVPEFVRFAENTVVVAHNAPFDMLFINWYLRDLGVSTPIPLVLDTIKLSKAAFPELKKHSLDSCIEYLGLNADVDDGWRHRALYDALHTSLLLIKCIERLREKNCTTLQHLMAV